VTGTMAAVQKFWVPDQFSFSLFLSPLPTKWSYLHYFLILYSYQSSIRKCTWHNCGAHGPQLRHLIFLQSCCKILNLIFCLYTYIFVFFHFQYMPFQECIYFSWACLSVNLVFAVSNASHCFLVWPCALGFWIRSETRNSTPSFLGR
jgi:hypothetical protein